MWQKIVLPLFFIYTCTISVHAQITLLAGWDTDGVNTNTNELAPTIKHPLVPVSNITKGGGLNTINSYPANTFSAQDWTTGSTASGSDYFEITLSVASGYILNLSHLQFNFRRDSNGPKSVQWAYSTNGTDFYDIGGRYSPPFGGASGSFGPVDLTGLSAIPAGSTLTLRLYGFSAKSGTGAGGIGLLSGNDLEIFGTIVTGPPSAPILTLSRNSNIENQANLSWTIPSNTTSFTLARSQNNGPFQTIDANIPNNINSYEDTLISNGKYSYALHALNGNEESPSATLSPRTLMIESPDPVKGAYIFSSSFPQGWGMDPEQAAIYSNVVLFQDGSPGNLACADATNAAALSGKIAFLYRGDCAFASKALRAQNAGAIAVIIVNNENTLAAMSAASQGNSVTIPVLQLTSSDGSTIRPFVDNGQLQVSIGQFLVNTLSPSAPVLTATKSSLNGDEISLSWTVPNSTDTFHLERSFDSGAYTLVSDALVSANTTADETSLADGTYTYRIIAFDSFGNESTAGLSDTLSIDTAAPDEPSLTATKTTTNGNSIDLSWTVPSTTNTFRLERSFNAGGYSLISNSLVSANVSTNETSLADGTYTYQLIAIDSFGNESIAGLSDTLTIDTAAPAAPSLTATKSTPTGNSISLSWTVPNTTNTFRLEQAFNAGGYISINDTLVSANVSTDETGLSDGTYTYKLIAIDSFGNESTAGVSDTLTIDTVAPDAPTNFTAIASGNIVILNWINPISNSSTVTIRSSKNTYPTNPKSDTLVIENTSSTNIQLSDLEFNTTYKFSIFAIDAFGNVSDPTNTSVYTQIRVEDLANTPQIDSGEITIDEDVTTPIVAPQIGVNGTASVNIQKNYISSGGEIGVNNGSNGTLVLSEASAAWTDTGDVIIGKNGEGKVLQSSGTVSVSGTIVIGKEAGSSGNYTFAGGTLSAGALQLKNKGSSSFDWTGGTLKTQSVIGNLDNQGGTLDIPSDQPITIVGNYSQNANSTIKLTLKETSSAQLSSQRTRLASSTTTALISITGSFDSGNGTLTIEIDNFNPVPNTIVTVFSSPPTGTFSTLNLPDLDSRLSWDQSQLYSAGILTIVGSSADMLASRPLNAPNPFKLNEGSMLGYYLNTAADIELRAYKSSGNEVFRTTFIKDVHEGAKAGYNRVMLSRNMFGQDLSAGIYPYLLISDGKVVGKGKLAINPE